MAFGPPTKPDAALAVGKVHAVKPWKMSQNFRTPASARVREPLDRGPRFWYAPFGVVSKVKQKEKPPAQNGGSADFFVFNTGVERILGQYPFLESTKDTSPKWGSPFCHVKGCGLPISRIRFCVGFPGRKGLPQSHGKSKGWV